MKDFVELYHQFELKHRFGITVFWAIIIALPFTTGAPQHPVFIAAVALVIIRLICLWILPPYSPDLKNK